MVSKFVHCCAWLAAILTGLATAYWVLLVAYGNYCWGVLGFTLTALPLGAGIFILGLAPSSGLCIQTGRQRRDWISLALTGGAFVILLVETILVNFIIPQGGE